MPGNEKATNIDTAAVLNHLALVTPDIIGALEVAGCSTWPRVTALATWLLCAAFTNQPELAADFAELHHALQTEYLKAAAAFDEANPGYQLEVRDSGSVLILVPPVTTHGPATVQ